MSVRTQKSAEYRTNTFESGTIVLLIGVLFLTFLANFSPYMVLFGWLAVAISLTLSIRLLIVTWAKMPRSRFFLIMQSAVATVVVVIFAPHTYFLVLTLMHLTPRYYQP